MFRFIKTLFRRTKPAAAATAPSSPNTVTSPAGNRSTEGAPVVPRVETAQLSLAAVMSRFPDDLRKLVLKMPPPDAMVVLPLPTIQKMLPTGSVKMSLASVVRQAPPGTFSTINPQDKRLVEVPLAEIFKRISPALLKKRPDQKLTELAAEGFDIFGDDENPHVLAPRVEGGAATQAAAPATPTLGAPAGKVLKVAPGVVTAPPPSIPLPAAAKAAQPAPGAPKQAPLPKPKRLAAMPAAAAAKAATATPAPAVSEAPAVTPPHQEPAAPEAAPAAATEQSPLVIAIKDVLGSWPEPIKSEAAALNGVTVSLPAADVASGLAKGKVAFAWGQLRSWMTPPPTAPSESPENTELVLPLRVIAPAFLKHTKGSTTARKAGAVGDIPELFAGKGGLKAPPAKPAEAIPEPAPESAPEPEAKAPTPEPPQPAEPAPTPIPAPEEPAPAPEAKAEPTLEPAPVAEPSAAPVQEAAKTEEPAAKETEPVIEPEPAQPQAAPAPAPAVEAAPAPAAEKLPQSLGELFGQPDKSAWSPTEVVRCFTDLPGVAGAIVALQEGLVIAHKLPEPLKGEIFAAFLPQIFARLNQYSGEMKLGGVNEMTFNTEAGVCHIFRRGQVFFAALGKPESPLSLHNLRLCADAVAS